MSLKRFPTSRKAPKSKVSKTQPSIKSEPASVEESVKDSLIKLISLHAESAGEFATGSALNENELPKFPLIDIQGYGILPTHINQTAFTELRQFFEDSPYGLGEETLMDKSVRNSIQLDPAKFVITNHQFASKIQTLIETKIKFPLGLVDANVSAKPYKLLIYEKGGKFEAHRDTEKVDGMFGTMIVQLPSIFTGGNLVVSHNGKQEIFKNSEGSSTCCKFVAHYSSCLHELQEITSGYRVALVYSLCWDGNGIKPSPYVASANSVKLCNLLNTYLDNPHVKYLCWGLDFEYSRKSISNGNVSSMKGKDKYFKTQGILNALSYDTEQYGRDRFDVYFANVHHKIDEYGGDCRACGSGSGWRDCRNSSSDDADGGWNFGGEEYYLDELVPAVESSTDIDQDLKIPIQPAHDLLNYDENWDWGSNRGEGCCSGPDEVSTRERWFQKEVVILWKKEKTLELKCLSSDLSSSIEHVHDSVDEGEIEDTKKRLEYLMTHSKKFTDENRYKVIGICCKVDACNETLDLVRKISDGIVDNDNALIISKVVDAFSWDVTKDAVLSLLAKCPASQTQHVILCCNLINLDILKTFKILVDKLVQEENKSYHDMYCQDEDETCNYRRCTFCSAYQHVLELALHRNTFPNDLMEPFLKNINKLSTLLPLIKVCIEKSNGDLFLMSLTKLIPQLIDNIGSEQHYLFISEQHPDKVWKQVVEMLKLLDQNKIYVSLKIIVDHILALPNNQAILKSVVAHISAENKENLPECFMEACEKRLVHLHEIALVGKPSWKQPNAIVPGHPKVEEFLRSREQRFTYSNFGRIAEARRWISKYSNAEGCYNMTLSAGGVGCNAFVEIVKTDMRYRESIDQFDEELKEYKRLVKVVPGYEDATLKDSVKPSISSKSKEDSPVPVTVVMVDTDSDSLFSDSE